MIIFQSNSEVFVDQNGREISWSDTESSLRKLLEKIHLFLPKDCLEINDFNYEKSPNPDNFDHIAIAKQGIQFICGILAHNLIGGCRKHWLLIIANVIDFIKNSELRLFYLMQYQLFSMSVKLVNKYLYNCVWKYWNTCGQLALCLFSVSSVHVCLYLLNMARWDALLPCQVTCGLCLHFLQNLNVKPSFQRF